jgi:hypothetical protein
MVYRIRYCYGCGREDLETVVEANSPTEAMVKFRHTCPDGGRLRQSSARVTSIRPEMALDKTS